MAVHSIERFEGCLQSGVRLHTPFDCVSVPCVSGDSEFDVVESSGRACGMRSCDETHYCIDSRAVKEWCQEVGNTIHASLAGRVFRGEKLTSTWAFEREV